jgi:DNA-binding MarR family transcriptional regulator
MTDNTQTDAAADEIASAAASAAPSATTSDASNASPAVAPAVAVREDVVAAIAEVEEQMSVLIGFIQTNVRAAALAIDPTLQPFGLKVLRLLAKRGPLHSSVLADTMFVDRSIISRQVKQLQELGLVETRADPEDGRARYVAATDEAIARLATIRGSDKLVIFTHMNSWPEEDLLTFAGYLKRLTTP